jgi:hypothetical protein
MYRVTIRSLHAGEAQPDVAELQPAPGQRAGPLLRVQPRRLHRHAALPRLRARAERQPPTGFPMSDGSLMLVCCYVQKEQGGGSSPGRSRGYRPPSVWPRASSSCTEASCPASSATTSNILLDQNLVAKIGSYNRNGLVRGTASDWCRLSQPWQRKIRR